MVFSELVELVEKHWNLGAMVGASLFVSGFAGAVVTYFQLPDHKGRRSLRGFFRFLLPPSVFFHRSAINDYRFAMVHKLTYPVVIAPIIAAALWVSHASMGLAETWFGPPRARNPPPARR